MKNKLQVQEKNQGLILQQSQNFIKNLTELKKGDAINPINAVQVVKYQAALTVPAAFESPNRINSLLRNDNGRNDVFDILNNLIFLTNEMLNVKHKLNEFQVIPIVEMIMTEYKELTIDEVAVCFRNGARGQYGPTMHRFDIEVVSDWLKQYYEADERWNYLESRGKQYGQPITHQQIVDELTDKEAPKELTPVAKKILKELKEHFNNIGKLPPNTTRSSITPFSELIKKATNFAITVPTEDLKQLYETNKKLQPSHWYQINLIIEKELNSRNETTL